VGDAIEVRDFVTGEWSLVALAGPPTGRPHRGRRHRRAHIALPRHARHLDHRFFGACGLDGASEKTLKRLGDTTTRRSTCTRTRTPGTTRREAIAMKLLFRKSDGRLLGAQASRGHVDKRISALAMALQMGATIHDLEESELCYAPPFGSAKTGQLRGHGGRRRAARRHADQPLGRHRQRLLLDVREAPELAVESVPDALNIPLGSCVHVWRAAATARSSSSAVRAACLLCDAHAAAKGLQGQNRVRWHVVANPCENFWTS